MADINLIPTEEINLRTRSARSKLFLNIGIGALIITSALTTLIFAGWVLTIKQIGDKIAVQKTLASQIDSYAKVESLNKFISDQLQVASKAVDEQPNYNQAFRQIRSFVPEGVKLTELSVTDKNVSISGSSSNSVALSTFVGKLISDTSSPDGYFTNLSVGTLTGKDDGSFQFVLTMQLRNLKGK